MNIKTFVCNSFQENCYIISNNSNEGIIIDPGFCSFELQNLIKQYIISKSITLKYLLNTHLHLDHILGNKFIQDNYAIKALGNEKDFFLVDQSLAFAKLFGFIDSEFSQEYFEKYLKPYPITNISEGDSINIKDIELQILSIPGHTPGHLAFYCKKEKIIFSGDALFKNSIGRTDMGGGDPLLQQNTLINSIKTKILSLPDDTIIYTGHGLSTTVKSETVNNPYLKAFN